MDTGNRLTAARGEGGKGYWMNEGEGRGLAKEHICMTYRHRQQCGDGQQEGGRAEAGVRWVKVEKMGTSVIVSR